MSAAPPTVLVLAKEPVPGRVKTRLCPPCTPAEAATIAGAAIADTVATVTATASTRPLLVLDGEVGPWLSLPIEVVPQGHGDLGDRLAAAFSHAGGRAVLIGMDTPQVTADQIDRAIDGLGDPDVDAVLGLTADGGWWIIGFAAPTPLAFEGVAMSRPTTGTHQYARLTELGLRTALVDQKTDVDTFADALTVADAHPDLRFSRAVRGVSAAMLTSA